MDLDAVETSLSGISRRGPIIIDNLRNLRLFKRARRWARNHSTFTGGRIDLPDVALEGDG